jgi:hypothetical protein
MGYEDKTKQKYDSPNFRLSFNEFVQRTRVGGRWLNRLRDGHVSLGALSMSSLASLLLRYAVAVTIYAPLGLKSARGGA